MLCTSQITTVKGRREHVERHLDRWLNSGIDELVLVDYACPENTGQYAIQHTKNDPRLTVVMVPEQVAGNFFHLTKARNIGALAARHESFLFCDVDHWMTATWLEFAKTKMENGLFDLLIRDINSCDEETVHENDLPINWARDGQCLIRNHAFHALHGYNERHVNWGGENYDLYIRAASADFNIDMYPPRGIHAAPHSDALRDRYLEMKFGEHNTRQAYFSLSLRKLKHLRRLSRATPGKRIGVNPKESLNLRLFRGGRERTWRPGEDDL